MKRSGFKLADLLDEASCRATAAIFEEARARKRIRRTHRQIVNISPGVTLTRVISPEDRGREIMQALKFSKREI
jgi:hypothetical protein